MGHAQLMMDCSARLFLPALLSVRSAVTSKHAYQQALVPPAFLQAASDLELQCPVCWEERKGCVFQCGKWQWPPKGGSSFFKVVIAANTPVPMGR
jgi:hypothetical protein